MPALPRLAHFPTLGEKHFITSQGTAFALPVKDNKKAPIIGQFAPEIELDDHMGRRCVRIGPIASNKEEEGEYCEWQTDKWTPSSLARQSLHATIQLGRPIVL